MKLFRLVEWTLRVLNIALKFIVVFKVHWFNCSLLVFCLKLWIRYKHQTIMTMATFIHSTQSQTTKMKCLSKINVSSFIFFVFACKVKNFATAFFVFFLHFFFLVAVFGQSGKSYFVYNSSFNTQGSCGQDQTVFTGHPGKCFRETINC